MAYYHTKSIFHFNGKMLQVISPSISFVATLDTLLAPLKSCSIVISTPIVTGMESTIDFFPLYLTCAKIHNDMKFISIAGLFTHHCYLLSVMYKRRVRISRIATDIVSCNQGNEKRRRMMSLHITLFHHFSPVLPN
jgi:hypothetical protein